MPTFVEVAEQVARDEAIARFFFLGSGPLYGIAAEGMFKIKEYAGEWAEAFHPLEFRHGPRAAANSQALVVALLSDRQAVAELRVLKDMKEQGARTMAILDRRSTLEVDGIDQIVELDSGLDEWERGALALPLLQLIGLLQASKAGMDPDHPASLRAVTQL
jgi:glucosamine--fructose-6-phosphate aminotransferase (isomerizing)